MHIFECVCVCVRACMHACVCDYMQPLNLTHMYMDVRVNITNTFQLMEQCHETIFGLFAHTLFQPMLV